MTGLSGKREIYLSENGFTLVEALACLGIISLFMALTLSVFSAAVNNNKTTQDIIEAKLAAEKYMEIIKSVRIAQAETVLSLSHGFYVSGGSGNNVIMTNDELGITVEWAEESSYSLPAGADLPGVPRFEFSGALHLVADAGVFGEGQIFYKTTIAGSEVLTYIPDSESLEIKIAFSGTSTVYVENRLDRKLTIYCVNNFLHEANNIPSFIILEGRVNIVDQVITSHRLPEEAEGVFANLYRVTVTVSTENGYYQAVNYKAVY